MVYKDNALGERNIPIAQIGVDVPLTKELFKSVDLPTILFNEQTGNVENKYQIKFNNFTINLYKTISKFKNYDTIYESNKIKISSNFYLPIELIKITNYEKVDNEITYGIEKATNLGIEQLSKKIETEKADKDNILQKYVNLYAGENYVEVEVIYEVLEDIGTKEKIVF